MAESFPTPPGNSGGSFPQGSEPAGTVPAHEAGLLLFRRYQVIRELGRGGMGVVVLAHDTALEIPVAVKLVPELVVKDSEAIFDLRKEVLRGMALNHDGVVRTHHFEKDEGSAGIVMELVDGFTLAELKQRQPGGCFNPEQILPWIEQLCAVLDYAHQQKHIVHRDLKPRNIMVTHEGRVKVADFGIAALISDSMSRHSMEGKMSGTLHYMSPQQAQGLKPSLLDDIHALGATIYELLTGKPPFFRGSQVAIHAMILNVVPPSMTARRHELEVGGKTPLPAAWEETIAACLAKEANQRPQRAGDVFARLKSELRPVSYQLPPPGHLTPPATPVKAPEPVRPRPGSPRFVGIIVGGVVLGLALLAAGIGYHQASQRKAREATPAPTATPAPVALASPTPPSLERVPTPKPVSLLDQLRRSPAPPAPSQKQLLKGRWKEYWGKAGETNVTYNDEYRIAVDSYGTVLMTDTSSKEQKIDQIAFSGSRLSFSVHTSFEVKYTLDLQPDGKVLTGTAQTPNKVVEIRWEKIGD